MTNYVICKSIKIALVNLYTPTEEKGDLTMETLYSEFGRIYERILKIIRKIMMRGPKLKN